jgi:hypothetical protein
MPKSPKPSKMWIEAGPGWFRVCTDVGDGLRAVRHPTNDGMLVIDQGAVHSGMQAMNALCRIGFSRPLAKAAVTLAKCNNEVVSR